MKTKHHAPIVIVTLFAALASCYFTACTAVSRANWSNFAIKTLGSVAVNTLTNMAAQEMSGGKTDYGHALAGSLWANMGTTINGNELYELLNADAGGKLPTTTKALAQELSTLAVRNTPEARAAAFDAAAKTISEVASRGYRHD